MSPTTASPLEQMFSDSAPAERAAKFEAYKGHLAEAIRQADSGDYTFIEKVGMVPSSQSRQQVENLFGRLQDMQKGLSTDAAAALEKDIATARSMMADIAKDFTTTNPLASGAVPYDLQIPIKELVPLHTPLRNSTTRNQQGKGLATHWKSLDSLNNSGQGAAGVLNPFINSQADPGPTFGSLQLRRGTKINYTMSDHVASYVELGYSDLVTYAAQFAGQGFTDARQLSKHALTWTHLMGEERAILYGRGLSANGYVGAVSAPVISIASSATGGGVAAGTYYTKVTAVGGFGESVVSNEVNTGALTGGTNQFTVTVATEPVGAINYKLYVGTSTGTETFVTAFTGNSVTILVTPVGGGAAMPSSDTTATTGGFDGWLPVLAAQGGYVKRVNAKLSTSAPGSEFQTAFLAMYQNNFAEPNEIWLDANAKVELGTILQNNAQNLPFRIQISQESGVFGTAVTGMQNQLNSQMVPLNVHPFMPSGAAMLRSTHLPYPAQGISETSEMRLVQDYMAIDWPQIQYTYDSSTYEFGTLVHYAPAFSGLLLGIL